MDQVSGAQLGSHNVQNNYFGAAPGAPGRRPAVTPVRQVSPRLLGVHAAIQVDGAEGDLPAYVARDVDERLRRGLAEAAGRGGFVLLVGGSSVGKTRALYEAVLDTLPDWGLVHPAGPAEVRSLAEEPPPRTVVWLDELQTYLTPLDAPQSPAGRDAETIAADAVELIRGGTVLAGTIWPVEVDARMAWPVSQTGPGRDRKLLDFATKIGIDGAFSAAEKRRASDLASADPRIRVALRSSDAGFTQVLAAGPELVRRWEQASDPYGKALITVAVDARLIGISGTVPLSALVAAVPAYLTNAERATAPPGWIDRAVAYATAPLLGAAAALSPVAGESMGEVAGYQIADYLFQHAVGARHRRAVPDTTFLALASLDTTATLGRVAEALGRLSLAEPLYRRSGVAYALAQFLDRRGRGDEAIEAIRGADAAGDEDAGWLMIGLLARYGRFTELRARARRGDWHAAFVLVREGKPGARWQDEIISTLVENGRVDEAIELLRHRADDGEIYAAETLSTMLVSMGRIDEVRERVERGDATARWVLADHAEWEEREALIDALRERAARGSRAARRRLAELLGEQYP
ncbi:hypothetical protein AB0M02_23600 [Actinoplanes sp. NPDC051861]|uniref:hypothetical protein n=1 Tax=Actinoplanes sp. NPDC051861 TaxID=3155170 RepID=UPI00343B00BC